jgi:hypothetical protein
LHLCRISQESIGSEKSPNTTICSKMLARRWEKAELQLAAYKELIFDNQQYNKEDEGLLAEKKKAMASNEELKRQIGKPVEINDDQKKRHEMELEKLNPIQGLRVASSKEYGLLSCTVFGVGALYL